MRDSTKMHPDLQVFALFGLYRCNRKGLQVKITETYRTIEEQDGFYAEGSSQVRGSNYGSMHQWGVAFDVCRNDGTGAYNFNGWIKKVAKCFKVYPLAWGGNWNAFVDQPHFQMSKYQDVLGGVSLLKLKHSIPTAFMDDWADSLIKEQFANLQHEELEKILKERFTEIKPEKASLYCGKKTLKRKVRLKADTPVYILEDNGNGRSKVIVVKNKKIYTGYVYNFEVKKSLSPFESMELKEEKVVYKNKYNTVTKYEKKGTKTNIVLLAGQRVKKITTDEKWIKIRYKINGIWEVGWIQK